MSTNPDMERAAIQRGEEELEELQSALDIAKILKRYNCISRKAIKAKVYSLLAQPVGENHE